jgi:DNA modification methylase
MKKFDKYQKNVTFINGDCFKELDNFDDKSIDCVITSPPYFREREKNKHFNLNQTIEQYLDSILEFSNKIYRILKDEGSFWLNIGDAYSGGSLMLIPFLVANKLKEAGWILNNDIIWSKNSYTPTSYSKRLSNSYEHFFHFVKTKEFYYNLTALDSKRNIIKVIDEKVISSTGVSGKNYKKIIKSSNVLTEEEKNNALNELEITLNKIQSGEINDFRMIIKGHNKIVSKNRGLEVEKHGFVIIESKYNRPSDIWEIDTEKKGIHYAPFPEDLVEFPIKVTCPLNGIILDPFCGSGTVNFVALQNNKQSIGIELKDEFLTFAKNRCNQ